MRGRHRAARTVFASLAALVLVTSTQQALAFCRTTTCDPSKVDCNPAPGEECTSVGKGLFWPNRCVSYSLQQDAAPTVPYDTFAEITRRAFQSWLAADCSQGQGPSIEVQETGPISCDAVEYNRYAGNANIIMFRSVAWPYSSSSHTLALTTVTFNTENGHIYDVDIEVNAAQVAITTTDNDVKYDLEAILAHELGHYFGLAHSGVSTATMFSKYAKGTIDLRSPEADDHAGVCTVYPVDRNAAACDPTPRRGLQLYCGDGSPPEDGCAACAVGASHTTPWKAAAWIAGLAWLATRRRRGVPTGLRRSAGNGRMTAIN
jgi:MYXO-CTERM domain-containing protein